MEFLVIPGDGLEQALALATGAPVIQPGPKAGTASRTPTPSHLENGWGFIRIVLIPFLKAL
jgi:hypothetical protein